VFTGCDCDIWRGGGWCTVLCFVIRLVAWVAVPCLVPCLVEAVAGAAAIVPSLDSDCVQVNYTVFNECLELNILCTWGI